MPVLAMHEPKPQDRDQPQREEVRDSKFVADVHDRPVKSNENSRKSAALDLLRKRLREQEQGNDDGKPEEKRHPDVPTSRMPEPLANDVKDIKNEQSCEQLDQDTSLTETCDLKRLVI